MNKEEKKQYMKVWYQKNKRRVLKKQQKIRDDAKIVSTLEKKDVEIASEIVRLKNSIAFFKAANNTKSKKIQELKKENAELKEESDFYNKERGNYKAMYLKEILKKNKAKEIIKELLSNYKYVIRFREYANKKPIANAEQFLNGDGCPDTLCEDCTKKDCTVKKLGLVGK